MNIVAAKQLHHISVIWPHAQQTLNALDIVLINNVAKRQELKTFAVVFSVLQHLLALLAITMNIMLNAVLKIVNQRQIFAVYNNAHLTFNASLVTVLIKHAVIQRVLSIYVEELHV
jgi:hypothetical protein